MTAYDYHSRDTTGMLVSRLVLTTPPHGCNLIFLTSNTDTKPDYTRLWNNL